ncbi:MAG TPA: TMEM165/GDT1 family protein [Dehalococcoidia bacterium]|nr:TMEM165/GDT1 family protein [Dehalococcoidia bacterium]
MDWRLFFTTFGLLFVAELGDKTQLTVITLVARNQNPVPVFLGAVIALALVTLLGVVFGQAITQLIPETLLHKGVAVAFVAIGALLWFEVL